MTLEKSGYRVEQAKDGHEAMEKLRKLQTLPIKIQSQCGNLRY